MSLNAAAIAVMVRVGLTAADILAVAEALEIKADRTGAERQARYRERHKVTRDVTRDETPPPLPPLKSPPDPQKITPPISPTPMIIARPTFPPPGGVEASQWKAFRQQRKKAITDRAYLMICNKLHALAEAGWPPGEMIDLAIERGWETVFEPKDQHNGQTNQRSAYGPKPDPTLALLRAAMQAQREDGGSDNQARLALPASGFD